VKPDGPIDPSVAPSLITDADRPAVLTLMAPRWRPADSAITQSYGICFDDAGQIALAATAPGVWTLPGGTIEAGESPEEALVREVAEEICGQVLDYRYLAVQHVWDPDNPQGRTSYYQSRWWARVRLDRWEPRHEIIDRTLVESGQFLLTLSWAQKDIAARLLEMALTIELPEESK
jgi:ADP-ribose pyrophosphatase YjhB (NUDIX family)